MNLNPPSPQRIIRGLIATGRTGFGTYDDFLDAFRAGLSCELDYAKRLLAGSRRLSARHIALIQRLLDQPDLDLFASANRIAADLGLPRSALATDDSRPAIDFHSRSDDGRAIRSLFDLIKGYWELAFWSFSRKDKPLISRELCIVDEVGESGLIACRIIDVNFTYSGSIFPVSGHLYFMLEKDRLYDEVMVLVTNRPDRVPPVLRGINVGLAGGVDDLYSYPCAGRIAFRYLGATSEDVCRARPELKADDPNFEQRLADSICRYVDPDDLREGDWPSLHHISNRVDADQLPFVLRGV